MILELTAFALIIVFAARQILSRLERRKFSNYCNIPWADGWLPIVGHGLSFKDVPKFIENCRKEHGDIFKIQIFNRVLVIVCSAKYSSEFFSFEENNMSLYDVLRNLYFGEAFSDDPKEFQKIITVVKKTVAVRFNEFVPKIKEEAQSMLQRLDNGTIDLRKEMIRFVTYTSARCFIGIKLNSNLYQEIERFTNLLNKIVVLTYFLPRWVLDIIFGWKLTMIRKRITSKLRPIIQQHRDDDQTIDKRSPIIDKGIEENLSDQLIGDIIVCLLYVSSENTALGLCAALYDLAVNKKWQMMLRKDLHEVDSQNCQLLDWCALESARLHTHMFPLNRKPKSCKTIGNYYLGNEVDVLALSSDTIMRRNSEVYANAEQYNPWRFRDGEPVIDSQLITWGSKWHLCPGKQFARLEIQYAIAAIVGKFQLKLDGPVNINYFSPSAFSEIDANINLSNVYQLVNDDAYIIRQYLSPEQQQKLINNLAGLVQGVDFTFYNTQDYPTIPYAYYRLNYTGTSNCKNPEYVFDMVRNLGRIKKLSHIQFKYNSMYSQLYLQDASMHDHVDQGVDEKEYGVSISLGASCVFRWGGEKIVLRSGDIFIGNFGKISHGIETIVSDNMLRMPLGRVRMSIQLRNVDENNMKDMKFNEFMNLLKRQ